MDLLQLPHFLYLHLLIHFSWFRRTCSINNVSSWSTLLCVVTVHIHAWKNCPIWTKNNCCPWKIVTASVSSYLNVLKKQYFLCPPPPPLFYLNYNFQSNLRYFPKNRDFFFFPLMFIPLIFHSQYDKFRNNWSIKGTRRITLYAFKMHKDYEVLYMKKADQSYFILSNSNKGKLQSMWQRHINWHFAKM